MQHPRPAVIASFVVDHDPVFAYTGWNLAHSLVHRARFRWPDVHVQFTPEVEDSTVDAFSRLGCTVHRLKRLGDGKYCNKIGQWENLRAVEADHFVLLDTDMICVADFAPFVRADVVGGKVVDLANPGLETLDRLFELVGFGDRPETVRVDASAAVTYRANCNGGFYSIPRAFADSLFASWRSYAELLLADLALLREVGKEAHVDQIAFCMAIHKTGVPFEHLPSNLNYYLHFAGEHGWRDTKQPLAMLHFHNSSLNVVGLLEPAGAVEDEERAAVDEANALIERNFNTRLFWDLRYARFPERGSGVGSRGQNLSYKRELLRSEGAEDAQSVLDVGCGDLEVVRSLQLHNYVGIDRSESSLAKAAAARPEWTFRRAPAADVSPAELVLCFEVAIHQETAKDYRDLISFVSEKAQRTLIISGYDTATDEISSNHMVFFYEPLARSLEATGKFRNIEKIGQHSTVVIYRCDVG
jgi:hypothetical protein